MTAIKLFWMAIAFMLLLATMANAGPLAEDDDDNSAENALELPELRSLNAENSLYDEFTLQSHKTKNVFKYTVSYSLNKNHNI
jgi:hypothetical protein